jgi:hypothetical protein
MRRRAALPLVVVLLSCVAVPALRAQPKPQGNGVYRLEGTVVSMDKDASRITLRQRSVGGMAWTVRYTGSTSFSYRNTITSVDDVKVGRRVICIGRFGQADGQADGKQDKNEMTAVVIDVRSGK